MLERIKVFLCLELPQTRKAIILVSGGRFGALFFGGGRGGGVDLNFERELKISKKIAERMWQKYRSNGKNQGTFCSGLVSQSKYGNPPVRALARAGLASLVANLAIASLVPLCITIRCYPAQGCVK